MLRITMRKAAVVAVLVVPLAMSGCWYGPEDLGPFALGEVDGTLVVIACEDMVLSDAALLQRLVINGDRRETRLVAESSGEQRLARGEPFDLQAVPSDDPFGLTDGVQAGAYYYVESLTPDGEGATATFRPGSAGLPSGMWLGSDQSVNETPCDYWSD